MRAVNISGAHGETKMASNEMENETFLGTVCQTCTWLLTGCSAETKKTASSTNRDMTSKPSKR